MANTNLANITLLETDPVKYPQAALQKGTVKKIIDTGETPTILSINDTVTLARVHVEDVIDRFELAIDDLGTAGDLEVGFYRTLEDGAAAVDADALINLIDVNAAATARADFRFDTKGIETAGQKAWELAGLTALPDYDFFDIKANALEATTAAGTISVFIELTDNG